MMVLLAILAIGHTFQTPEEYYKKQYFEAHDLIVAELNRRFQHKAFEVLQGIENLFIRFMQW